MLVQVGVAYAVPAPKAPSHAPQASQETDPESLAEPILPKAPKAAQQAHLELSAHLNHPKTSAPVVVATAVEPSQDLPGAVTDISQYGAMSVKELRKIASDKGIDDDAIERARDADNPRAELVALIQAHEAKAAAAAEAQRAEEEKAKAEAKAAAAAEAKRAEEEKVKSRSLLSNYGSMTIKELREIAAKKGVAHEAIEHARDGDDPRAELIALITTQSAVDYGSMAVKELREIAAKKGVAHEAIENARDGDDPKAELIALITTQSATKQGP